MKHIYTSSEVGSLKLFLHYIRGNVGFPGNFARSRSTVNESENSLRATNNHRSWVYLFNEKYSRPLGLFLAFSGSKTSNC